MPDSAAPAKRRLVIVESPAKAKTIAQYLGDGYEVQASVGHIRDLIEPKNLPPEIAAKLTAALKKAFDSKDYKDFMNSRGFGMKFADGPGFASFMAESDKSMASAMKAAGLAKG